MSRVLRPINNRVLVKRVDAEDRSRGGIIIPDSAKTKAHEGTVLALSEGRRIKTGAFVPHDFRVGEVIVFEKWSDTDMEALGTGLLMVEGDDVLGVRLP